MTELTRYEWPLDEPSPQLPDMAPLVETQLSSQPAWQGRILQYRRDEVQLPNGLIRPRDVILHPGGVVVAPVLSDGRLIFVRQWRYALGGPLLEFPAGKLDTLTNGQKEAPDVAVRRELEEETGYKAATWQSYGSIVTSPGFCDERLWLYVARDLTPVDVRASEDEEETIQLIVLTPAQAWQKAAEGELFDAKTLSLLGMAFPKPKI